jgi:peptidoglycan/LPS O-acetylase OafA/YrhL
MAAIAVVFRHLSERSEKYNIVAVGFNGDDIGLWGVDLFFVISGFIMVYITNISQASYRIVINFWLRRFVRISPLYYIMTTLVVIMATYMPGSVDVAPNVERTIKSILYIPNYKIHPVLGVGWTLNYEMYFYFVFGLVLFLSYKYQVLAMAVYLFCSVLFGFFYQGEDPIILQMTNPLLMEFMFGVFVGRLFLQGRILSVTSAIVMLSVSFFVIFFADILDVNRNLRALVYGVPSAGLVSALISLEAKKLLKFDSKLPLLAGDSSYSLYLVHLFVIGGYGKIVMKFTLFEFINGYVLLFCGFIACFLTGVLIFKLLEQPLHVNLSKRIRI